MPQYLIQKRIHTLLEYAIFREGSLESFSRKELRWSSWERDMGTAWKSRFWLVESEIQRSDFMEARKAFQESLTEISSRVAFVGQAYHANLGQPYLIRRANSDIAFFRHSTDRPAVPFMFTDDELGALDELLNSRDVPNEFYLYWNDAINALGYSSKLLLMFCALEALFQKALQNKSKYYAAIESVFGADLKKELYGTREDGGKSGLRQRLVHGAYLAENDTKNYVEIIHKHIVRHFNDRVLRDRSINDNVVRPQRHPYGNMEGWQGFIKSEVDAPLDLKSVLNAFEADINNPIGYEIVPPEQRPQTY